MKYVSVVIIFLLTCGLLFGAVGDKWELAGDMQTTSNPSSAIDPGTAGGGTATWGYYRSTDNGATYVLMDTSANSDLGATEFPTCYDGWTNSDGQWWNSTLTFCDSNGSNTDFQSGDFGGHGFWKAVWTTDHTGVFDVNVIAYGARTTPNPAVATFQVIVDGTLMIKEFVDENTVNRASPYTNTLTDLYIESGGTILIEGVGPDYVGAEAVIEEIYSVDSSLTINAVDESLDPVSAEIIPASPADLISGYKIPVHAQPVVKDCGSSVKYVFSHWSEDSNADVNDTSDSSTYVKSLAAGAAQITAHYTTESTVSGDCRDYWDLSEDMQNVSNPSFYSVDPGLTSGTAKWYYGPAPGELFEAPVISDPSVECNSELPTSGLGWTYPSGGPDGTHRCLNRYASADGSNTNYQVDSVGGHSPINARWVSDYTGLFAVEVSGYSARTGGLAAGRILSLLLKKNDAVLDSSSILSIHSGEPNALVLPVQFVSCDAGDTIDVQIDGLPGDWAGMTAKITEVSYDTQLTISGNFSGMEVIPYVDSTQDYVSGYPLEISAAPKIDCVGGVKYEFSNWVETSNVDIDNTSAASTIVTVLGAGPAEVTAVYTQSFNPPECDVNHWDIPGAIQRSLPNAPVSASPSFNPVTVGNATWEFTDVPGGTLYTPTITPFPGELPAGYGWENIGKPWESLSLFTANDGEATVYEVDDTGGHAVHCATWKTLSGGWFDVDYSGYFARNFDHGDPVQFMIDVAGVNIDSSPLMDFNSGHLGSANAYTGSTFVYLETNETISVYQAGATNWTGVTLDIDIKDSPATLTIQTSTLPITPDVEPFIDTQPSPINVAIPISASRYVDCENDHVFDFVEWQVVGDAAVADANAQTTLTINSASTVTLTAVYADDRTCGDECHPNIDADFTGPLGVKDCVVDFYDLEDMASMWLDVYFP